MEQTGQQKSFEEAAFEVFKALCPGRNFNRDEIPYQTVKEMIGKHLDNMDPEKRQHFLARIKSQTGQSSNASDGKNEVPGPSTTIKPKTVSEGRCLLLSGRHHLLPKLEDFNEAQKIHLKYPKNVRKFVRMRTERRLAAEINDYVNIVCDEQKLPEVFRPLYDQILRKRKSSLECYHVIINTLHHYFMRVTWSDNVPDVVDEFIANHILRTCDGLTSKYDREESSADIYERLREYELMVLLEFHMIKKEPGKIDETDIVNKLGFLVFVADASHMKNFLDEVVCDQFAHIMPKALVYVYEELCIKMPLDLEDPSTDTGPTRVSEIHEAERRSSRKTGLSSAALLELERGGSKKERTEERHRKSEGSSPEFDSGKSKIGLRARAKKAARISKRIAARQRSKATEKSKLEEEKEGEAVYSSSSDSEGLNLGDILVPPTPKSHMKKKHSEERDGDSDGAECSVPQTPLSKLNRIPTRRSEKLSALLVKTERRLSQRSGKGIALPTPLKTQMRKSSRSSLPALPSTSTVIASGPSRMRSARVNLRERFAVMDRMSQETNSSATGAPPATGLLQPHAAVENIVLDKNIVERYRKRIETVRHSARKSDKNEVFYGRCTSRRNLFDDDGSEDGSEGVATRSASCMQKNRSGRSVQTSRVYMAHALLNAYNTDPLNPPKPPKDCPFKLHRLIRPASKSDKKRLSKFKLRIAREKTGLSSGVVVSGSPSEASEATSSPQSLKAKSESPEEKLSNGNEKSEKVSSKESPGNSSNLSARSEKSMELFKEPSPKKSSRKLSETTKNPENEAKTLNEIQKKRLTKGGKNVSGSSNGMLSKTPSSTSYLTTARADSLNGESLVERSEKSSNGAGDISKTESKHISSHISENPETDIPKKKVRKTNFENQGVKLESSSGKSTNSTRLCGEVEEDMEIA